jgi:AraC-like DNA-binding protein
MARARNTPKPITEPTASERRHVQQRAAPASAPIDCLAQAIARHVHRTGDHQTALPALSLHRRDRPTAPLTCTYPLSLAITAQGEKQVMVGDEILDYRPGQSLVTTVELSVVSYVTRATPREPYLGLRLMLDAHAIALAGADMKVSRLARDRAHQAISIEQLDHDLLDALRRLVALLDNESLLPRIAPLIHQEILIRLLAGPHRSHLQLLMTEESPNQQIARVLTRLKENRGAPVRVEDLAAAANMSPSTFRQHFRAITGMSPLQYQKELRLQEARQLMLHEHMDASQAARRVGYLSASQFSRDYSSRFGAPPHRDVRRLQSG